MGTRQVSVEGKVVGFDCDSNCCSFYINLSAGTDRISMTRKIRSDHRHTCRAMQPIDFIHYKTKMSVEKMTKKWVHASSDGLTIRWRINGNPTKLPDDIVPLASSQRVTSTERTRTKTESGQKKNKLHGDQEVPQKKTRRSKGVLQVNEMNMNEDVNDCEKKKRIELLPSRQEKTEASFPPVLCFVCHFGGGGEGALQLRATRGRDKQ